ncbi:glutamate racemase [Gemmatimonas sp.]|uniref:glutamate racemase n=1 Tax=Gemmatimonas sp. TaxID=1962908 RepID=UPI0033401ABC
MGANESVAAIGVFDSGLGGLTVARAVMQRLPAESLIYVGDSARVPYGPKSPDTVRRYALQIGQWLLDQQVKCIVVACNTATAHALPWLQAELPVPVIGVIQPGARAAVRATTNGPIGVIGTAGTVASGAYTQAIHDVANRPLDVHAVACPLFVPLVEEGWTEHPATRLIAHQYLEPLRQLQVDAVVLGCTHYPLLRDVIAAEMGGGVTLIDSAAETAVEVATVLTATNQLAAPETVPSHRFVASDAPKHFLELGSRFLGRSLGNVEHHVFT